MSSSWVDVVVFLERLEGFKNLPPTHLHHLDRLYQFDSSANAEIRLRWYRIVLPSAAGKDYAARAAAWLVDKKGIKGRMKFCRPIFSAVNAVDSELAKSTWGANRQFFHPIARRLIDKVCYL